MRVDPYNPDRLPQLTALVNTHLGAAVPGPFYERLGLRVLVRETNGWVRP